MTKPKQWNERFALIAHYNPTDEQIIQTFGIPKAELDTARQLLKVGTLTVSSSYDAASVENPFVASPTPEQSDTVTSTKKGTTKVPTASRPTILANPDDAPPETATAKSAEKRKRGRKGTKISEAFRAIPETPISVDDFAAQYGVSIPVLRQSKRFDTSPDLGRVVVKVDKDSGKLQIWREKV